MPIPVLVVVSFVGFLVYIAIGSVVGTLIVNRMTKEDDIKDYVNRGGDATSSPPGYFFGILFWPVLVAAFAVVGIFLAVFALPVVIGGKVSRYVADVAVEKGIKSAA